MIKLYKDGKKCSADPAQVCIMEKAGWSKSHKAEDVKEGAKPEVPEVPKVVPKAVAPAKANTK